MTTGTQEVLGVREQMQARLEALKKELETGQIELQKIESQRTHLRETMLRIGGAIQVLEELLAEGWPVRQGGAADLTEAQLATRGGNGDDD